MAELSVPWGPERLELALPTNWTVGQVAQPALRPASDKWTEHLARAVASPGAGPPLGELLRSVRGGRVAIIVEDHTRHSPLPEVLEVVMREVHHAGVSDEQIELVIATGMHPPMTPEQVRQKVGPLADALAWRCNPWSNPAAYARVGRVFGADVMVDRRVATADLRIVVSSVSPHLQAGFGGGYKMLIPGCAALGTIREMHRRGVGRSFSQMAGVSSDRNAMRAFVDAAGRAVDAYAGRSFAVQYVLDDRDLPTYLAAGEVAASQQMLAKQCAVACGVLPGEPADVVIANAHPRDTDLWQSFKSIANTLWAARPGGVVICLARCPRAAEGMKIPRFRPSPALVRRVLRLIGPEGLGSLVMRLAPGLAGDAAFFVRIAMRALHRNPIVVVSPGLREAGVSFPGLPIVDSIEQAVALAGRHLGDGPQRVTVFPAAGISYAIPGN